MKNYQEIKANHSKEIEDLITKHKGFFAFSESQLLEGMAKINIIDRKELTSLSMGLLMPKIEAKNFLDGMANADKNYKKEMRDAKRAKEEAILYELNNHEAFYTGRIDETAELFAGIYSQEDIKKVFNKHNNK